MSATPGRKKTKQGVTFALLLVAVFLMVLMNHLLNYDYNPRPIDDDNALPSMRGSVTVVEWPVNGSMTPCAGLTLTNTGNRRLTLLDSETLEPLYEYDLQKRMPDGSLQPLARSGGIHALLIADDARQKAQNSEVTLLPGRSMTVYLPLSIYDLRGASGIHNISVRYRPDVVLKMMKPEEAERLSVTTMGLTCQTDFELPLKKVETPVQPSSTQKPSPPMTVEPSKPSAPPLPIEVPLGAARPENSKDANESK